MSQTCAIQAPAMLLYIQILKNTALYDWSISRNLKQFAYIEEVGWFVWRINYWVSAFFVLELSLDLKCIFNFGLIAWLFVEVIFSMQIFRPICYNLTREFKESVFSAGQ